jgi:hypothetical protein
MPPQLERALVQVFVPPCEIFDGDSHCLPPKADLKVGLYDGMQRNVGLMSIDTL